MKPIIISAVLLAGFALGVRAAGLKECTFTQVINDVNVTAAATKASQAAKVNDSFKAPDLIRTGAKSRAELQAPDKTLTRIGANTVFSIEPAGRNLKLEQGSLLFHSPAGKGGGTIKSAGASASVLGTTLLVACTLDGGFKTIVLEGRGTVTLTNGRVKILKAGEMIFIPPGAKDFGPLILINLDKLVGGSSLVGGFPAPLPSLPSIRAAISRQNLALAAGRVIDTGAFIGGSGLGNDPKIISPSQAGFAVGLVFEQKASEKPSVVFPRPAGFAGGPVFEQKAIEKPSAVGQP